MPAIRFLLTDEIPPLCCAQCAAGTSDQWLGLTERMTHFLSVALLSLALSMAVTLKGGSHAWAQGSPAEGARVFDRCSACHQVGAGAAHGRGPHLNGLMGRVIAGAAGYRYSDGLAQRRGEVWTPAHVRAYVSNPAQFSGGRSSMPAQRLRQDQMDDLIAYLASQGG
ncbi:MAG: c-type cytochrome [Cohaesibacteraceae bacterium]